MSTVYLLQNQYSHFLDRSGDWVTSENNQSLYRTTYKDEAINQKVEFSVKNPQLRITITEASVNEKGKLQLANGDTTTSTDQHENEAENDIIPLDAVPTATASNENPLDTLNQELMFNSDEPNQSALVAEPITH